MKRGILSFSLSIKASETEKPKPYLKIAEHKARLDEILLGFKSDPNNRDELITRYNQVCLDMFSNVMEVLVVDYEAAKKCNATIPHSLYKSLVTARPPYFRRVGIIS